MDNPDRHAIAVISTITGRVVSFERGLTYAGADHRFLTVAPWMGLGTSETVFSQKLLFTV